MLNIKQAYKNAWELVKSRPWYLMGFFLLVYMGAGFVSGFFEGIADSLKEAVSLAGSPNTGLAIAMLVSVVIAVVVRWVTTSFEALAVTLFSLEATRRQWPTYSEILKKTFDLKRLFNVFIASVIWFVITGGLAGGIIFLLIGAWIDQLEAAIIIVFPIVLVLSFVTVNVLVSAFLYPYMYLVVEGKYGPIAAIKASINYTSGKRAQIVALLFVSFAVGLLGIISIGGIFIAALVNMLAFAYIYREMIGEQIQQPQPANSYKSIVAAYLLTMLIVGLLIILFGAIIFIAESLSDPTMMQMLEQGRLNSELIQELQKGENVQNLIQTQPQPQTGELINQ